jgi:hypothetical protein
MMALMLIKQENDDKKKGIYCCSCQFSNKCANQCIQQNSFSCLLAEETLTTLQCSEKRDIDQ